ncbi:MAG: hypothetical protein H0T73_15805, partial [Ardenticatenales bacterium]|nr:hypothetical protein [Ardenticatenales bacterium]
MASLAESLGPLFEVGFNVGVLTCIQERGIPHGYGAFYREALAQLKLERLVGVLQREMALVAERDVQALERWLIAYLHLGFQAGRNFLGEFIDAVPARSPVRLRYLQCKLWDENTLGTYQRPGALEEVLAQLGVTHPAQVVADYKVKRGTFLHADLLLLFEYHDPEFPRSDDHWRLLVIDASIFQVQGAERLRELDDPQMQRELLNWEIHNLRSKSEFARLSLDTSSTLLFPEGLERYYRAFLRGDKETAKLIQAGSYAHSFYDFLKRE